MITKWKFFNLYDFFIYSVSVLLQVDIKLCEKIRTV